MPKACQLDEIKSQQIAFNLCVGVGYTGWFMIIVEESMRGGERSIDIHVLL